MRKLRIMSVGAARPNFMKLAPFIAQLRRHADRFEHFLVHTGQHYDAPMSDSFFRELDIPEPDANLGIGSGTHAEQVGRAMIEFEKVVRKWRPNWIVVVGDVNATCACSITAAKEWVKLAHIEAGLRSFDPNMPEEINRMVADRLSHLLFTTDEFADHNLISEGVAAEKIRRVGNIMIDTLEMNRDKAAALDIAQIVSSHLASSHGNDCAAIRDGFALLTLHRPSNVDEGPILKSLARYFMDELSREIPLLWALHPRTRSKLEMFGLWKAAAKCPRIFMLDPLGYREMLKLNMAASVIFTDSGGVQEECCLTGTPCITLRASTERPITLRANGGVSTLTSNDVSKIRDAFKEARGLPRKVSRPSLWDGHTAERIVEVFMGLSGTESGIGPAC